MLHVHRGERADRLVDALADVLKVPLGHDPFEREVVAVHSRGIERWLTQELAGRLGAAPGGSDGVCANVDFPFPGRLVGCALAAAGDPAGAVVDDERDPWMPNRLVWRLLDLVQRGGDLDLGPLAGHLADPATRFGALRQVADLYDRYSVHRPGMIRAWARGELVDAGGLPLGPDRRWQAALWCAVRDRIGLASRAERLDAALARLREDPPAREVLPPRLSLFGLTALPASYVEVLHALAVARDVHLFLLHPSPALWDRVAEALAAEAAAGRAVGVPARDDDPTIALPSHPLLASWGRDAREVQVVLAATAATAGPEGAAPADRHLDLDGDVRATLLARIQADVRADRRPPGPPLAGGGDDRAVLDPGDGSLVVHSCHGRTRQVEVMRDAIGHALAADPDLEPRDVVVMCPDVEEFAPLVNAVFGASAVTEERDARGLPELRVRIADRSLRQTNPLLDVVTRLLDLADSRVEASRVLDLAGRPPVRRRFRLDDDDLSRFEGWVDDLGIRWGLDADHRTAYDLDGVAANSWQAGLDRLLAGVAVADEDLRMVGPAVPYDHVEGDDVDRAGRLAELITRLRDAVDRLSAPQPIAAWREQLEAAVDRLTWTSERDAWQRHQLRRILGEVVDEAAGADGEPNPATLTLAEVRGLLADRLRGRPTRANHRTGELTVCTLVPMRSVPYRVIGLLGMDDTAFPKRVTPDGDDLVQAAPRVGDRDPRTEDRQLLLDALLATRDRLIVTYTGHDERTNEPKPPAVPIGELLDVVDATTRLDPASFEDGRRPTRDHVVVEHPLQPFDPRNFTPGRLRADVGPWSFDPADFAGAVALRGPKAPPADFLAAALPPDDAAAGEVVALDDLVAFLTHPVRAFLGRRLGVRLPRDTDEPDDAIPVEVAPLGLYGTGQGRLEAALAGHDLDRWEEVERARGSLPPGRLADPALDEVRTTVTTLLAAAEQHGVVGAGHPVEVDVPLPDGRSLVGTVPSVVGDVAAELGFARLDARQKLRAYARLVALTVQDPTRPWTALAVGRNRSGRTKPVAWCRLGPLGDDPDTRAATASQAVAMLLDLYDRGLCEPLPLFAKTSAAYAEVMAAKGDRYGGAGAWDPDRYPENADPEHVLAYGPGLPYDALVDGKAPRDDEVGDDWPVADSRFEVLARRLWDPILACREEGQL